MENKYITDTLAGLLHWQINLRHSINGCNESPFSGEGTIQNIYDGDNSCWEITVVDDEITWEFDLERLKTFYVGLGYTHDPEDDLHYAPFMPGVTYTGKIVGNTLIWNESIVWRSMACKL